MSHKLPKMSQPGEAKTLVAKSKLESALKLNSQMQLQLLMAKEKIEKLLKTVQEVYSANDSIMRIYLNTHRKKGVGIRGAYLRGGTFYLKGNMFFKDFDCRNCPDNPDYKRRKAKNEMFPMDLDLKGRHVWSLKDKKGVVEGIKEQIIQYLHDCGKDTKSLQSKELNSEKLVKLLEMAGSNFHIDWDCVSQYNLQYRHSAKSCEAIWNVYLHPSIKRHKWSEEENLKLLKSVQEHKGQDWKAIAEQVGGRSDFQCFVQYQNYVCYMTAEKSNKWVKEDDARLIEVIERNTMNGIINWSNVMVHFPQKPRTTLQCRYSYSLSPHINHAPFTPEEDLLLLASVKEYGTKFSSFPRTLFPNRTTVQLRSRYRNTLVHRHKPKSWTLEDDTKLVEFVKQHGTKSWKLCEEALDTHSRISCRTRYLVISNFLQKNPEASLADLPRKKQAAWSYVNTQNWTEKLLELKKNPNAQLVKKIRRAPAKRREPRKKTERKKKEKPVKIVKIDEKPKKQKTDCSAADRRKPIYVERLRSNAIIMYHSFKYAYDARVGQDFCTSLNASSFRSLNIAMGALTFTHRSDSKRLRFDSNIPTRLRPNICKALRQSTCNAGKPLALPPSWPTAVGFRALCILSARDDLEHVKEPNLNNSNATLQMFRKRLRILFYTTALLSRIHPSIIGKERNQTVSHIENLEKRKHEEDLEELNNRDHVQKKAKLIPKSVIDQVLSIKNEKMAKQLQL